MVRPVWKTKKLWRLSADLWRPRPRQYAEWPTVELIRRWAAASGRPITIRFEGESVRDE